MVGALFDTNILIDYLNAVPEARAEISRYARRAISIVTWIEVLVGVTSNSEAATRLFLDQFIVVAVDRDIAQCALELRRAHRIKLPDALVWASAQVHSLLLVTRDAKDFPASDPIVRVPYRLVCCPASLFT